ncbi:MAG: hypothetical protein NVS2B7_20610 [Herpetosiphon sp.]
MAVAKLSVDDLARRCAEETDKFQQRQTSDPQFCFELLRRALVDEASEALTSVFHIYEPRVRIWVYSHTRFPQTAESAEYFAAEALRSFYFALRGTQFERIPSLPQALSYLKLCVHTAILRYLRDQPPKASSWDDITEQPAPPDVELSNDIAAVWQRICQLLPHERDQLLARCTFVENMKPRQIVAAYRAQWPTEREISVALYRIRRVLRNDAALRARTSLASQADLDTHQ